MKKRYQKAPRISTWDRTSLFVKGVVKNIEEITGEKIPDSLRTQILKTKEQ